MTFGSLRGVISTEVGYTGGDYPRPTYETVCAGDGHTEALQIVYDPEVLTYEHILSIFWKEHNCTQRTKAQYKSAIYCHNEFQREIAEGFKAEVTRQLGRECVTDIEEAGPWHRAEEYHQKFMTKSRGY